MDNQIGIYKELFSDPFAGNITRMLYPRRRQGDFTYVEASYKVQEPNDILPEDTSKYFEHDVIIHFHHLIDSRGRKKVMYKDVISIEIAAYPDRHAGFPEV